MLFGVKDGVGTGDVSIPISLLAGDTTGNGIVSNTDVSQTKAATGGTASAGNFRTDVVVNGTITNTDVAFVKSNVSAQLPIATVGRH
jgi:hypothetical protein